MKDTLYWRVDRKINELARPTITVGEMKDEIFRFVCDELERDRVEQKREFLERCAQLETKE